jgi:RNA binding exosome subunit
LKPRKALNKAFLKVKPNRTEIEGFKTNLITLLDSTNDTESEEFHKNLISDFLKILITNKIILSIPKVETTLLFITDKMQIQLLV